MIALIVIGAILLWFVCGVLSVRLYATIAPEDKNSPNYFAFCVVIFLFGAIGLAAQFVLILLSLIGYVLGNGRPRRFLEKLFGMR